MAYDPLRPKRVADYYTRQHLTMRQIGKLEGITGPAVCRILHRLGIPSSAGERATVICANCHTSFSIIRSRLRKTRRPSCSAACYYALRKNPQYQPWRHGQRMARAIVRAQGFQLLPGYCVHHHDANNRNNALSNLAVFASQSDHLRYHHTGQPQPIWDGRAVVS